MIHTALEQTVWDILNTVPDPEIPAISIVELGVVRSVSFNNGVCHVALTPTYAGCPALEQMQADALAALNAAGLVAQIEVVLSPAWTTDWLSDTTREKLRNYGIAPPHVNAINSNTGNAKPLQWHTPSNYQPACPQCASRNTERVSEFGSTACKALYRCTSCLEPFDYFKPY